MCIVRIMYDCTHTLWIDQCCQTQVPSAIKWVGSSAHSIDPNLTILQQTDAFGKWGGAVESFRFLCLAGNTNSSVRAILASKQSYEVQADLVQSSCMFAHLPWPLSILLWILRKGEQPELLMESVSNPAATQHVGMELVMIYKHFRAKEHKHSWSLP